MRNAPSVTYPVGLCAFYGRVLWLCSGLGLLALLLMQWSYPTMPLWWAVSGWLAWGAWCGVAVWSWRRQPVGRLQWDARAAQPGSPAVGQWFWQTEGVAPRALRRLDWVLDAQSVLLLRLQVAQGRPVWVWLQAVDARERWDDLRRALMAHT